MQFPSLSLSLEFMSPSKSVFFAWEASYGVNHRSDSEERMGFGK